MVNAALVLSESNHGLDQHNDKAGGCQDQTAPGWLPLRLLRINFSKSMKR